MKGQITRSLPNDEYQAAIAANAPSAVNPFATMADLAAIPAPTLASVLATGNTTGGNDISVETGDRILMYDNAAGTGSTQIRWNADNYIEYDDNGNASMEIYGKSGGIGLISSAIVLSSQSATIPVLTFANNTTQGQLTRLPLTGVRVWSLPDDSGTIALINSQETMLFASGEGIDSIATGGSDVLNIGVTNANVINYGNASTTHNFLGTAIYELQVNSYVTDKLITLNYGGAVASGIGVGTEIEENGVITGYTKTNAARTGWSFKAPANTDYTDLVFTATVPRSITVPDLSGTMTVLGNTTTGTPSTLVYDTSPIFVNDITTPRIIGGTGATSNIRYDGSSNAAVTATAIAHDFMVGNSAAVQAMGIYHNGQVLVSTATLNPGALGIFRVGQGTSCIDLGQVSGQTAGIWMGLTQATAPTSTNYTLLNDNSATNLRGVARVRIVVLNQTVVDFAGSGNDISVTPAAKASGAVSNWAYTQPANTNQTAGADAPGVTWNMSATIQHAGNTIVPVQRSYIITAPTYSFATAGGVITDAGTFVLSGAPNAGANASITRPNALWVQSGMSRFEGITAHPIVTKTTTYTATIADHTILADATAAGFTITLPPVASVYSSAASTNGNTTAGILVIKKIDATGNIVTIDGNGSETIDGSLTQSLDAQWEAMIIQAGATGWYILSIN